MFVMAAAIFVLVAAPLLVVNRDLFRGHNRSRARHRNIPLPPLVIPSFPGAADILPAGVARHGTTPAAAAPPRWDAPKPVTHASNQAGARTGNAKPASRVEPDREVALPVYAQAARPGKHDPKHDLENNLKHDLQRRAADRPIQPLPGRLHVLSGDDAGSELRLFSKAGERTRIVVGRESGPSYRCVTLHSPTVSRRHARIEFIDGEWTITNLSETNPVLLNDRVLPRDAAAKKLANGDRIELGEVALRFLAS
jgi:hypothetical protein